MVRYYNPVDDIMDGRIGRPIYASSHAGAMSQIKTDEHLYYMGDRLIFRFVACVDDENDFNEFHRQYRAGMLVSYQLYALGEEDHARAR